MRLRACITKFFLYRSRNLPLSLFLFYLYLKNLLENYREVTYSGKCLVHKDDRFSEFYRYCYSCSLRSQAGIFIKSKIYHRIFQIRQCTKKLEKRNLAGEKFQITIKKIQVCCFRIKRKLEI